MNFTSTFPRFLTNQTWRRWQIQQTCFLSTGDHSSVRLDPTAWPVPSQSILPALSFGIGFHSMKPNHCRLDIYTVGCHYFCTTKSIDRCSGRPFRHSWVTEYLLLIWDLTEWGRDLPAEKTLSPSLIITACYASSTGDTRKTNQSQPIIGGHWPVEYPSIGGQLQVLIFWTQSCQIEWHMEQKPIQTRPMYISNAWDIFLFLSITSLSKQRWKTKQKQQEAKEVHFLQLSHISLSTKEGRNENLKSLTNNSANVILFLLLSRHFLVNQTEKGKKEITWWQVLPFWES